MTALRCLCIEKLSDSEVRVNNPSGAAAPHILSLTLPRIKSETMLNYLSGKGICVSSGSACSSHSRNISSALVGFGLSESEADTTVRVSFSYFTTEDEVNELVFALDEGVKTLVRIK
jgi:cysteine desulfurase